MLTQQLYSYPTFSKTYVEFDDMTKEYKYNQFLIEIQNLNDAKDHYRIPIATSLIRK